MRHPVWLIVLFLFLLTTALAAFLLRPATEMSGGEASASESPVRRPPSVRQPPAALNTKRAAPFSDEDYSRHVMQLKTQLRRKLPPGFTIRIEQPFVVVGDDAPEVVARWSRGTIRWAVQQLQRLYFSKGPEHIIDIWLFKDAKSYRRNAKRLFGEEPSTPFGYYSAQHRSLVMDISTGGGTLVHELVHPFIEANFPRCPAWFNEGLASLYEHCKGRDGKIVGLTNWRLPGLQKAIESGTVPSFKALTSTTSYQFYEEDPGTNYGQARYLCYYLQERGLLEKYYHAFVAHHERDPTGLETLAALLGADDMERVQKKWETFVSRLRFR